MKYYKHHYQAAQAYFKAALKSKEGKMFSIAIIVELIIGGLMGLGIAIAVILYKMNTGG